MDNIIIGFSKAKGFKPFSWAIRLFERTEYSHTYIKFYSQKYDRWMIYQASKSIVNFMAESVFLEHNELVDEVVVPITNLQLVELVTYAIDRSGKPYGMLAIIGIFLKRYGVNCKYLFDGESAFVCSELVARSLKDILRWDITANLDAITPKQLFDIVQEHVKINA